MIKKLLIYRLPAVNVSTFVDERVAPFVVGDPIPISPLDWHEEQGLSHWGVSLEGMNLNDLKELRSYEEGNPKSTVLDLEEALKDKKRKELTVEEALAKVGLRINPVA